ncbi:AraC-like transcriptional regulator QhpR [Afifella pfennigii]|uniref:AraC-like transcriptional regulator QhpR n=1 Tax=Afifella pfennigii TaxID=209897 RepID=UPI00068C6F9C|nr:AraC family transcriptional regulator [Afifella pfennigii]
METIFGRAGLRLTDLGSPVNELDLKGYCALFEEAATATQYDNIGLEFGQRFLPKHLGVIGYAAISSPTLAAALRNMERYFPAHQGQTSFGLLQDSGVLWLSYRIYDPRIARRRQDAELSLGMFCNIFKSALGPDWAPLEIRFEHERPGEYHAHEKAFGAPVRFGRRTNAIAFRRRDLDASMPQQDPFLFSVITPFLERRCALQEDPEDFATVVRNQIKLHLGDTIPTLSEIARILGLPDQAFQRRLKASGVAFADLLKAARHELALHYLSDPDMPLTEIAYCLGYSELSAFSRAFRNWTGMSPQRYRRTRQRRPFLTA